ncbi:MAG: glycosyltransferase [Gammaproteobacteria bacterium]|nr:glycosyltransferase [Gammaproteobacteria bacterium]
MSHFTDDRFEVIVAAVDARPESLADEVTWLTGRPGRGRQMNRGAGAATAAWLWFLHADSVIERSTRRAMAQFCARNAAAIGYCDLRYLADGPALTALNAIGANWRSSLFGLPYGDQGLCLPARWFHRLGGFREDLERGEDLDLVVRARHAGLPAIRAGGRIYTSAERYRQRGWLRTTLEHRRAARQLIRNARATARSHKA